MSYNQMMRGSSQNGSDFKDPVYQNYIAHHGVLGMHWGQHMTGIGDRIHSYNVAKKRKAMLAKAREKKAAGERALKERQEKLRKGTLSTKEMSMDELTEYRNRLTLEKNVSDLKKTTSRGYQFTETMMDSVIKGVGSGVQVATQKLIGDYLTNTLGESLNASSTSDKPLVDTLAYKQKNKDPNQSKDQKKEDS